MQDLNHWWSSDLTNTDSGDASLASSIVTTQQRIIRRILTNPNSIDGSADYIWNPDYGCGAKKYIGGTMTELKALQSLIVSQLMEEAGVAAKPLPEVIIEPSNNTLTITVKYIDISTGLPQNLSFNTGGAQ